jgi:hypothetical protein
MAQTLTPLPAIGEVITGQDVAGRELRISGHPEADRVVLSIWQSGRCLATVRLARADVPEVARALVAGLVPLPEAPHRPALVGLEDPADPRRTGGGPGNPGGGTVHALHPTIAGPLREAADTLREAGTRIGTTISNLNTRLRRPRP